MSDATLNILLTAFPPTLVALATLIVGVVNSVKANKIHVLVNSNLDAVKAELTSAQGNILALQEVITKLVEANTTPAGAPNATDTRPHRVPAGRNRQARS